MFSALSKRNIEILATFNFSSANAFNLVTSKNLSFGKGLMVGNNRMKVSIVGDNACNRLDMSNLSV